MSHAIVRTAIAAVLARVPGIGRVHTYERYLKSQAEFVALYQDVETGGIQGWHIRRLSLAEGRMGADTSDEVTAWQITGYRGINDAEQSELALDGLIDRARDEFRADPTLGGVVASTWVEEHAGLQLLDSGPVMFAGVLCHKVVLGLPVQRFCPIGNNE